jgi:hypothetical protein
LARLNRTLACIDLPIVTAMSLPPTAGWLVALIQGTDGLLGLGTPVLAFPPMAWLFLHVGGILGVMWAVLRLARPDDVLITWIDAGGRLASAALIVYCVAFTGATPVLLIFLTSEVGGAVVEFRALPRPPNQEPSHA